MSPRETLVARSVRTFREKVRGIWGRARDREQAWFGHLRGRLDDIVAWEVEHCPRIALVVGGVLLGIAEIRGLVRGGDAQGDLAASLVSCFPLLPLALTVVTGLVVAATFVLTFTLYFFAKLSIFLGLGVWMGFYALWRLMVVSASLLALIPLSAFVAFARVVQLSKGIFYTCPSRTCAYRGLPIYVCPDCAEGNKDLWPNLYGLAWHECTYCGRRLPTMDILGRRQLGRKCGGCEMPLVGKHAGRARERLVAIVGGPGSGKTNYLLMAVHQLLERSRNGHRSPLRGEIDDASQEVAFQEAWRRLASGEPAAKTAKVMKAVLLYASVAGSRCQLYLYDAPGEELTSISAMTRQQYFPLLEGFILLVDPSSLSSGGARAFRDVVNSTLAVAAAGRPRGSGGRIQLRVAVVLSKVDLEEVRCAIGDVRAGSIEGPRCREAIVRWGGEASLRAIEHRFDSVEYFACSALGRTPSREVRTPFEAYGVLEPLVWVLTGKKTVRASESLNNGAFAVSIAAEESSTDQRRRPGSTREGASHEQVSQVH